MKGASWLVAGGTVAGLIAVLSYHSETLPASSLSGSATAASGAAASPRATASPAAGGSGKAGKGTGSAGTHAAAGTAGTATGPEEQFGYGQLDVQVTVRGGRITAITVPSLQTAEPTSEQISQQAIPMLTSEVISAQGLSINAVSGATYTSEAYARSLQAALDKLGFK
jgi:uncharacterized protein with FMN-binding domain